MAENSDFDELPNDRIIAIDGTSGSGKSTIARELGIRLNLHVLETGTLYRAATLLCLENNIDVNDEDRICELVSEMDFKYEHEPFLGTRAIAEEIRKREIASQVSHVSVHPKVRKQLTNLMRKWIVEHNGGVVEGRDITSVVAPKARVRLYIDAPEEIRALRRASDPGDNKESRSQKEIQDLIAMRDKIDSSRKSAPLIQLDEVPCIDTSLFDLETIIQSIVNHYNSGQPIKL